MEVQYLDYGLWSVGAVCGILPVFQEPTEQTAPTGNYVITRAASKVDQSCLLRIFLQPTIIANGYWNR